ncbi:MAG TPA: DUF2085 domain-containing protein [Anaerolineales bacterium]
MPRRMQATTGRTAQDVARWSIVIAVLIGFSAWMYIAPPGLMGKLDAIGYAVCHRLDSHSLHIGSLQMPLCARCTGEFNAAAFALVFQALVSPRKSRLPSRGIAVVLIAFFLAFAFDGSNSYLALMRSVDGGALAFLPTLYTTNSITRVLTGSGMGLAMGALLYPLYNQSVWHTPDMGRALDWRKFAILTGMLLLVDLGILTESPAVLYPVAVISALGVLALLTIVFSIVWITIMRQDNAYVTVRQLWLPAAAGLTLAFVMILGIDLVRLGLTHTWGGFPGLQG